MKTLHVVAFILFTIFSFINVTGQQYDGLHKLDNPGIKVYYSAGQESRAGAIALRMLDAIRFNQQLLGFKPDVTVLVLNPGDWSKHTSFPVYGMPHYTGKQTLIVASSDNEFWTSFIPPADQLDPALAGQIKEVYATSGGKLSMQPFFDLLALHELGHAFHTQAGLTMQRKWMGELLCNMLLHTYIAEREPKQLPALTVFPKMVLGNGTAGFKFTTLEQLENNYTVIAQEHPKNYGWYQSRWHFAAQQIYEAAGKEALVKLWQVLQKEQALSDAALAALLQQQVHSSVADVMLKW